MKGLEKDPALDAAQAHQGRLRSSFPSDNSRKTHHGGGGWRARGDVSLQGVCSGKVLQAARRKKVSLFWVGGCLVFFQPNQCLSLLVLNLLVNLHQIWLGNSALEGINTYKYCGKRWKGNNDMSVPLKEPSSSVIPTI